MLRQSLDDIKDTKPEVLTATVELIHRPYNKRNASQELDIQPATPITTNENILILGNGTFNDQDGARNKHFDSLIRVNDRYQQIEN